MNSNMKKNLWMAPFLAAMLLTGCSAPAASDRKEPADNPGAEKQEKKEESSTAEEENLDDDIELAGVKKAASSSVNLADYPDGVLIDAGGKWTLSGSSKAPVVINAADQDVEIVLSGAKIESEGLPALFVRHAGKVTITLEGNNTLALQGSLKEKALNAALYAKDTVEIQGKGSCTIAADEGHGIKAKDDLVLKEGTLNVKGAADGIHINDAGSFEGGVLKIESAGDEAVQSETDLLFNGSDVTIQNCADGLKAEKTLTINKGTLSIQTDGEGIESKDSLEINGGNITIESGDDALNAGSSLVISEGTVNAFSSGNDGIDSNGNLLIHGGTIVTSGSRVPEMAFDTDNTPFEITGGNVIGLGSSAIACTSAQQNVVLVNAQNLTSVKITQNSKTLLDWSAPAQMKGQSGVLTLSVPGLNTGSAQVLINEESNEVQIVQGMNTIGNVSLFGQGGMGGPGGRGGMGQQPGNPENGFGAEEGEQNPFGKEGGQPPMEGERPEMPPRQNDGRGRLDQNNPDTQSGATENENRQDA